MAGSALLDLGGPDVALSVTDSEIEPPASGHEREPVPLAGRVVEAHHQARRPPGKVHRPDTGAIIRIYRQVVHGTAVRRPVYVDRPRTSRAVAVGNEGPR